MSTITYLSDYPRKVTPGNLRLRNDGAQIHRFGENIAELREARRKYSEDIAAILATPPTFDTIPSKSEIIPILEYAMVDELQKRDYPLRRESLQAIHYIALLIMRYLHEKSGKVVIPSGQDYGREKISVGDKSVLHYVFGTHPKASDVYRNLREKIKTEYGKIVAIYENSPENMAIDFSILFREIMRITPHILDTLVESLARALSPSGEKRLPLEKK